MKSNYKRIGDFIVECDTRNDNDLPLELWGVSIDKKFIKSVANVIGTDLSKYKIVRNNQFVCSLMQVSRDEKIPIDLWRGENTIIVSPAYKVFQVLDTEQLLPEYLNMWFRRSEFDREASYYGVGGVRGSLEWSDFCEMKLPIPEISVQRSIVDAYNAIERRISVKRKINDNLAETIDAIFINLYQNIDEESAVPFCNLCSLASSKRVFAEDYVSEGVPFYRGKEITQKHNGEPINDPLYITTEHYKTLKKKYGVPACGDILITAVGTIGNSYLVQEEDFYFKDGNIIWLKDFRDLGLNHYLYDYMQTSIFKRDLEGICIGSTQTALTIVALSNLKVKIPSQTLLSEYCKKSKVIRSNIQANNAEILRLTLVAQSILASLSR